VRVIGPLVAPAARLTDAEPNVEALNAVVLLSDGVRVKVTFEHPVPVSLFLTVTEYAALPPLVVMVWDDGVIITVEAFAVQAEADV